MNTDPFNTTTPNPTGATEPCTAPEQAVRYAMLPSRRGKSVAGDLYWLAAALASNKPVPDDNTPLAARNVFRGPRQVQEDDRLFRTAGMRVIAGVVGSGMTMSLKTLLSHLPIQKPEHRRGHAAPWSPAQAPAASGLIGAGRTTVTTARGHPTEATAGELRAKPATLPKNVEPYYRRFETRGNGR